MTPMFSIRNSLLSALLVSAVILSAWTIVISEKPTPVVKPTSRPDAYMEDVVATIMNKQGTPSLKIAAPKMVHYPENDTTKITTPHVTIYRQSPQPWYIDSEYGEATNGTGQIKFSRHVVIHHLADAVNPNTVMNTASLTIFPDKQTAHTADAVVITQPDAIVHAVGMIANLNDDTIELLSQAKGYYVAS